ncbi:sugar porter family MFS transporter [Mycobacterium sp.]|uniref:sugar porter family MFS transporter n=1 Tax=Mycobacterium sp. TaxID=1785 RepID=UPI0031E19107
MSPVVMVGIIAVSFGLIEGYALSNVAGALLYITDEFNLSTGRQEMVAAALAIGEIPGAVGGGVLADAIGRKKAMLLATIGYAAFAVLSAAAVSLPLLLTARLLLGVAIGVSVVVVPVFVAESVPARVRGSLLVAYQLGTVVGIIVGYLVAYLLADSHSWRWMLGLAAAPAVLIMLLLQQISDTPRWYVLTGQVDKARQSLCLSESESDVEKELAAIAGAFGQESTGSLAEMIRRPYARATVFVVVFGFFVQATGINAITFYSPRLFEAMGLRGNFALLLLPALVQTAGLVAAAVALVMVDRQGRRIILLAGIAVMIAANAVLIGAFVLSSDFADALTVFAFIGVLLFTVGYNVGFGTVASVYAGECFPPRLRPIGSSAMLTSNLVASAVVTALFLTILDGFGGAVTFTVLGTLAAAAFAFVYRYAPETKGQQLEDIRHFWENGGTWQPEHHDDRGYRRALEPQPSSD